jgi:hypothetical protein
LNGKATRTGLEQKWLDCYILKFQILSLHQISNCGQKRQDTKCIFRTLFNILGMRHKTDLSYSFEELKRQEKLKNYLLLLLQ